MCFDSRVLIKVTTTITQNWTARVNCVAAYIHHVRPVYRLKAYYSALVTAGPCQVHESEDLSFPARELSSVQDGIYAFETPHNYALHPVSEKSHQRCPWNSTNVRLIGDGHLSSFHGRSSSAPSFYASLLQESDVVMSFVFYENVSVSEDTAEEVCAAELVSVSLKWPATMRQGGLRSQSWLS